MHFNVGLWRFTFSNMVLLLVAAAYSGIALGGPQEEAAAKIRALQIERLDVLRQRHKVDEQLSPLSEVQLQPQRLVTEQELVRAEIALCRTRDERVVVYQRFLTQLTAPEKLAQQMDKAGRLPTQDFLEIKATRLGAEFNLLAAQTQGRTMSASEVARRDQLRRERLEVLTDCTKELQKSSEIGGFNDREYYDQEFERLLKARRELLSAKLEGLAKPAERRVHHQEFVESVRTMSAGVSAIYHAGQTSSERFCAANSARLLAEIDLRFEQAKIEPLTPAAAVELKTLRAECAAIVAERRKGAETMLEAAVVSLEVYLRIHEACYRAERACGETPAARVESLTRALAIFKSLEKKSKEMLESGRGTTQVALGFRLRASAH